MLPGAAPARILVVDDLKNMRAITALMLRQEGHLVEEAASGEEAIEKLRGAPFDVVLTDLKMETMDGMETLARVLEIAPSTQVIVMTAYGTIDSSVEAMRRGAADYLTKPIQPGELAVRVQKALQRRRVEVERDFWAGEFRDRYKLEKIVGRSPALLEILGRAVRVAPTETSVVITGESGTGKELVARAIHSSSRRAAHPFVPVNCAAITETLFESELFGHARGAFTGAVRARRGLFEEANGGTFFFDEIAEIPLGFQAKLLRALQEHSIRRVGENTSVPVDARVIAATNSELRQLVSAGRFREDLYYRLAVVSLHVPPLRERREDVPLLAQHFLDGFNRRHGARRALTQGAMARLLEHDFPGNVRELENRLEQAASLAQKDDLGPEDLFPEQALPLEPPLGHLQEALDATERRVIDDAVRRSPDLVSAARALGVSETTLWRKMKKYGIRAGEG